MNWYKTAQDNWKITKMVSTIGMGAVLAILALKGMAMPDLAEQFQQNPQQVIQQAQQVQRQEQSSNLIEEAPIQQVEEPQQKLVEKEVDETGDIDLNKIWQIESTSGKDPQMHKPNSSGALGHFQFLEKTWNEMVSKMGKDWDWKTGALDFNKSKAVSDYYLNKRIPQMLNYFKIPDTIKTRIACYSWGVGYLKNAYEKYGENWESVAPQETKDYFVKYGVE